MLPCLDVVHRNSCTFMRGHIKKLVYSFKHSWNRYVFFVSYLTLLNIADTEPQFTKRIENEKSKSM